MAAAAADVGCGGHVGRGVACRHLHEIRDFADILLAADFEVSKSKREIHLILRVMWSIFVRIVAAD